MADLVAPVTRQGAWQVFRDGNGDALFTGTDTLSPADQYAHRKNNTFWTPSLSGSSELLIIEGAALESNTLALSFFGKDGTGGTPYHAIGAIWVSAKLAEGQSTEYRGTFLGEFSLELGSKQRDGTGGLLPDGVKWVKTINPVKDRSLFLASELWARRGTRRLR